jgi:hypothetical protein
MRYLTLGIVAAAASALMLSLAPVKAEQVLIGDYNGPTRQHGMCVQKGDLDGLGHLAPCPSAKKATAKRGGGPRATAAASSGSSE